MEDEGEPQLGSCSQEAGNGRHRHCQGNFEKAATASTKIACSDVALVEGYADGGRGDREELLPRGQSNIHVQDARGAR